MGLWTRVGPLNHVLDVGLDPQREGALLLGIMYLTPLGH